MEIRSTGAMPDNYQLEKPGKVENQQNHTPQVEGDQVQISGTPPDTGIKKKWTFLHYGAGDNNLSSYIYKDADEMEAAGSDANTHIISQLDQDSGTCKRYYIQKDTNPGTITSPLLEDMGSAVNMADPKTLTDFLVWGQKTFPGEHIALIIGDHGGGTDGAIADDRNGGSGMMKPADLEKAIKDAEAQTGKKLDVLGFDCCLMANTEVAYQLKDTADFMVASEESEGGLGWPYNNVLNEKVLAGIQEALRHKINVPPKEFAKKITEDAEGVQGDLPTMSTIDLSRMNEVAQKMNTFSQSILDTRTPMNELRGLAARTQEFSGFKDIYDFTQKVAESTRITDEKLKSAAKDVMASLDKAVIAEQHSAQYRGSHGLQIELTTYGSPSSEYKELAFARDTKWGEAMTRIGQRVPGEPDVVPGEIDRPGNRTGGS
ncbi:MAG: clostripain-related cysteine peptidase [Candidatus Xenobiia bacterium LiM19]